MEIGLVIGFMCLIVIAKGATSFWLGQAQKSIREAEAEEVEVLRRLESVEAAKLQLEREKEALDREEKLQESDKELLCMEIRKLGVEPVPESEVDAIEAARGAETRLAEQALSSEEEAPPEEDSDGDGAADGDPERTRDEADAEREIPVGADVSADGENGAAENPEPQLPRHRLLVVDDNQDLRELLEQILSKEYEVVAVADGYEALSKMIKEKQEFDLLITDLKMPNLNGAALVENMPRSMPTIVISAFLQRAEFREALERMHPVAMFEKPFKLADIRQAIVTALGD